LAAAIERAREFYAENKKASVHVQAAYRAWGFKTENGHSLGVLGAVRQYGLLEDTGAKMVRLSQLGLTIMLAEVGSRERAQAIGEAARRPKIFADLFEQYKESGFPSDESMVRNLALTTSYTEDASIKLIASFRETIDLIKQVQPAEPPPKKLEENSGAEDKIKQRKGLPMSNAETMDVPFPNGAVLRIPARMSETEFDLFSAHLQAYLGGLKAWLTRPQPDEGKTEDA
jgi:hypothetical protein